MKILPLLGTLAALSALSLSACTVVPNPGPPPGYDARSASSPVTGTITYYQRISLLPGSTATVRLLDIARADAMATVIDEKRYDLTGESVPFDFTLDVPDSALTARASLAVRAEIRSRAGTLLWTSDTVVPVETRQGRQDVGTIVLAMVRREE